MKSCKLRKILILIWLIMSFLQSCTTKHEKDSSNTNETVGAQKKDHSLNSLLSKEGDSITIAVNGQRIKIFKDSSINYNNPYNGIYTINKDKIVRRFSMLEGSLLYFTTYEDLGTGYRAYLFVYDMSKKKLIKNSFRKVNNVYSSAAVFFVEGTKVISIDRPTWNDRLGVWKTKAGIYRIIGNSFVFEKEIEEPGEKLMDDSSTVINFHRKIVMTR